MATEKVKIQMPIDGSEAVIHAELDVEYFGFQDNASQVLSTLLTAFYGYPIEVTVKTAQREEW